MKAGCRRPRGDLSRRSPPAVADQSLRLAPQRLQPHATGQDGRRSRAPDAPCRRAAAAPRREQCRRLDQVEECLLAPLDVVEQITSGACSSSSFRNAHATRPHSSLLGLAQQRPHRGRGGRIGGQRAELLHHLHHRPVRDPLPRRAGSGRRTARLDTAALRRPVATCRRPRRRPPSPPRSAPAQRPLPCFRQQRQLPLAADEARGVRALRAPCPRAAGTRAPASRLPLQHQRLHRLHLDRLGTSVASPRRAERPRCAACSSRAATFTASPVASRSSVPVTTSPVLRRSAPRSRARNASLISTQPAGP